MVSVYNEYNMVQENILEDMDKSIIAFNTSTPEDCIKVLKRLERANEKVFESTLRWLRRAECKFNYVICDPVDKVWNGHNDLTQIDFRGDNFEEKFTREFIEIKL